MNAFGMGADGPVVDFAAGTVGGKAPDPEIAAMAFGERPWTAEKLQMVGAQQQPGAEPIVVTTGEEGVYQQAIQAGVQLTPAQQQAAAAYGIKAPTVVTRPVLRPTILQPGQPGLATQVIAPTYGPQTAQEWAQSLKGGAPAQQQAGAKKTNTWLIVGGVAIGLAILYFAFKDRK